MTHRLYLGSDFSIPDDAVTSTFALFGKRGSGKTNGGTVIAEEMYKAQLPFVVLDPVDAWWGLKSSLDGKGAGLAIYVFGGPHGDLPLAPDAGSMMADVFIEHRISGVISFKGWTGADRTRFASAFAERLLMKNSEPLHVFLEEADAFVPQRPQKGEETMLGHFDRLVRWGRQSGLGCTLITQRSASVNKNVTTQAETLIAFRITGPQDRDAIDNWIKFHAGDDKRDELLASLSKLPNGTAWVWSPEWLELFDRKIFRRRTTFDSAATPKVGEKRIQPKQLAAVDLERLRERMGATIERAKAEDPRELKRQIVELKKQIAAHKPEVKVEERVKEVLVEVPVWSAELNQALAGISEQLRNQATELDRLRRAGLEAARSHGKTKRVPHPQLFQRAEVARPAAIPRESTSANADSPELMPRQQEILNRLAWLESLGIRPASKNQLAMLVGLRPTAGGFKNYLGALRSSGLIDYPAANFVFLTAEGRAQASLDGVPVDVENLHAQVRSIVSPQQWRILERLIQASREPVAREELAEVTGLAVTAGGFKNYLGELRTLGLVEYPAPGLVAATPTLFLEAA